MFVLPLLFFLLSIVMASAVKSEQCLKLLCDPDKGDCLRCEGMSTEEHNIWRRYIDALLENFDDEESNTAYYRKIREEPYCCEILPGDLCSIKLINEPKLPPHRLYEMGCVNSLSCSVIPSFFAVSLLLLNVLAVCATRTSGSPSAVSRRTLVAAIHPSAIYL